MGENYAREVVPGYDIVPVVPGAGALPGGTARALWIGSAGNINITTEAGVERDDVPAQAGLLPVQCTHVRSGATATAATNIWAIY